MAKKYQQSDFDQVVSATGSQWRDATLGNDHITRLHPEQEPLKQTAAYREGNLIPAIANDDIVEQQDRAQALFREFEYLEQQRSQLTVKEYEQAKNKLLRGALTLCRDPECSASPVANKRRTQQWSFNSDPHKGLGRGR